MRRHVDFVLVTQGVSRASTNLGDAIEIRSNVIVASSSLHISHEALKRERLYRR
jgi:hypothetical protein